MHYDLKSMTREELQEEMEELGEKRFRGAQLYDWMHARLAEDYGEMSNLPASLRERLQREYPLTRLRRIRIQESRLDDTAKFLFELPDRNLAESVRMRYRHGISVCISSQVGCRMGCRFCASTLDGLERNLLPSEMLEQVYAVTRFTKERVSHVVVMGTGEPLDNYDALLRFIRLLSEEGGLHISQRNVTVSTCGLVPQIRRLAEERLQITLAVSLHAAFDDKRRELMPVASSFRLDELMEACAYYFEKTGRRITFEYALVAGVNDSLRDAQQLSALAAPLGAHVNLIPVNPVRERNYRQPGHPEIAAFKNKLEKNKINVTIRREMGRDIDGACGQLRRRYLTEESEERCKAK